MMFGIVFFSLFFHFLFKWENRIVGLLQKELCKGKRDAGLRQVISNLYVLGKAYMVGVIKCNIFTLKHNQYILS